MSELRDQAAHAAMAAIALVPLAVAPNVLTGAWAGLCMGLVREVTEEGGAVTWATIRGAFGSRRDLSFWAVGGAIAGVL